MKILGFLLLLALVIVGYGYFFDHGILKQIGLGSLVAADDATKQAAAAPPDSGTPVSGGLVKCIDSQGRVSFSDRPCPEGQKTHAVHLSPTQITHLGPSPANPGPNQNGQNKDATTHTPVVSNVPEDHKQNAQNAINQKFFPQ